MYYDGISPFFFTFHTILLIVIHYIAIILATNSLVESYTCNHPRRWYPHRHRTRHVVLHNFPLSLRAALTTSRSSPIYSPRLIRHHTRGVASYSLSSSPPVSSSASCLLRCIVQPASCANNVTKLADLFVASYSPSYTSSLTRLHTRRVVSYLVSSRRQYPHRHRTRRVVLYNFPLSVPLRAALIMSQSSPSYSSRLTRYCPCCRIDVVLIALCLILQSRFVSGTRPAILPTLGTHYRR